MIQQIKTKIYVINVLIASTALVGFIISNWQYQNKILIFLQIGLVLFFLLTIIPVYKKKLIEFFSNLVLYLGAFSLIFNATLLFPDDQTPLVGLLSLLVPANYLLKRKYSFVIYSIAVIVSFIMVFILGLMYLPFSIIGKFLVVYISLLLIFVVNRNNELLELKKSINREIILKKTKLELQNNLKAMEKAKNELEKINRIMVNRELKMIELKKENQKSN